MEPRCWKVAGFFRLGGSVSGTPATSDFNFSNRPVRTGMPVVWEGKLSITWLPYPDFTVNEFWLPGVF